MKATRKPGAVILFGDGMHLVHNNVPGLCWADPKEPLVLKTNTGRKRLNILGAYNPDEHSFVHLTGEENCDAMRVIEYFEVILKANRRASKIILILDNATYYKAAIVLLNHVDKHVDELKTLMVEKFQIIKTPAQSVPCKT
ncbi:MAG: transposase [Desulfosarcina sp.]|nr:transposase [Desulfosarcina sp.]MBC2766346.1 hypothetical protein [Desulfosarcina sp.]